MLLEYNHQLSYQIQFLTKLLCQIHHHIFYESFWSKNYFKKPGTKAFLALFLLGQRDFQLPLVTFLILLLKIQIIMGSYTSWSANYMFAFSMWFCLSFIQEKHLTSQNNFKFKHGFYQWIILLFFFIVEYELLTKLYYQLFCQTFQY